MYICKRNQPHEHRIPCLECLINVCTRICIMLCNSMIFFCKSNCCHKPACKCTWQEFGRQCWLRESTSILEAAFVPLSSTRIQADLEPSFRQHLPTPKRLLDTVLVDSDGTGHSVLGVSVLDFDCADKKISDVIRWYFFHHRHKR